MMGGARPLLFGKLPAHGDFVSRGLDVAGEDEWDGWLTGQVAQARAKLGEDFDSAHEQAPAWRFVAGLGPGSARAGALAPSIDSVGRRYVIVLGLQGLERGVAAEKGPGLAAACEQLIYNALTDGLDADGCVRRLVSLEPLEDEAAANVREALAAGAGSVWWTLGSQTVPPVVLAGREPGSIFTDRMEEWA